MVDDRDALRELLRVSKSGLPCIFAHYLYVPTKRLANQLSTELKQDGFKTAVRPDAEGTDWLVLARHKIIPSEELITSTRRRMEKLASAAKGEYDGWEAEVRD
jgi:hypothetical protein